MFQELAPDHPSVLTVVKHLGMLYKKMVRRLIKLYSTKIQNTVHSTRTYVLYHGGVSTVHLPFLTLFYIFSSIIL